MNKDKLIQEIRTKTEELKKKIETRDVEGAKTLKEEIRATKDLLKIIEEEEEEEKRDLKNQRDKKDTQTKMQVNEMRSLTKAILGKEKLSEEERAVVKIADNQAIVPKQFINELEELRKGYGSLKNLCNVIPVTSESGTKPCVDLDQGDELDIVLEGDDIEDDSVATTQIDYKVNKIGKLIKLSSELVDDAVVDIENMAKTVFLEKAVRAENARILNIINSNATDLTIADGAVGHKVFAKEMDNQVPAVRAGLVTLVNSNLYSEWKNAEDKQGRNLNLITNINGQDYFNGKPINEFDDSLIKLTDGKTKIAYMVNMKEAVKFFDREQTTVAKAEKFENDTKMLRILERIDVKKGSTRSIKKLEF